MKTVALGLRLNFVTRGFGICTGRTDLFLTSEWSHSKTSTSKSCHAKSCDSLEGSTRLTAGRRALGSYGENLTARWYEQRGYVVVDRNWRCREGEIDLVLVRGRLVVFCEVKTRSSDAYGSPAAAVTPSKQARLRTLSLLWLNARDVVAGSLRFDVACVVGREVSVIESAF